MSGVTDCKRLLGPAAALVVLAMTGCGGRSAVASAGRSATPAAGSAAEQGATSPLPRPVVLRSVGPPVPWLDRPVSTPGPWRLAAGLAACRAGSLSGRLSPSGGEGSTTVYRVEIVNRSSVRCALHGGPEAITGVNAQGRQVALDASFQPGNTAFVGDLPAILAGRGGAADLALSTLPLPCRAPSAAKRLTALAIRVPTGTVMVPYVRNGDFGPTVDLGCGAFTRFAQWSQNEGGPQLPGMLGLTAQLPGRFAPVRGVPTLLSTVTLPNPGRHPIRLRPCPTYTEQFTIQRTRGKHPLPDRTVALASYRLNCRRARVVPAHTSIRIRIRLVVPRTFPKGTLGGTLTWRLNALDGTGPQATSNWCAVCSSPRGR